MASPVPTTRMHDSRIWIKSYYLFSFTLQPWRKVVPRLAQAHTASSGGSGVHSHSVGFIGLCFLGHFLSGNHISPGHDPVPEQTITFLHLDG